MIYCLRQTRKSQSESLKAGKKHKFLTLELSSRRLSYKNKGFQTKVSQWFNGDMELMEEFKHQKITTVYNRWTRVTTAYNSIRSQKPKHVQKHDVNLVNKAKLIQDSPIFICRNNLALKTRGHYLRK